MSEIVYVKEIPSLRLHVKNNHGQITFDEEMYTLLLPHLHEDFKNKGDNYVAMSCFPPFPYSADIEERICKHITENIKNSDTKIIFDNVYEGHTVSCINGIYYIIDKLNLNPSQCYFVSGGMQAEKFHKEYCFYKNIPKKLNIIVLNSWERHVQMTMTRHDLVKHFDFKIENKQKLFLCFNRVLRAHRIALLGLLYNKNLVDCSYYSFFQNLTHGSKESYIPYIDRGILSDELYSIVVKNLENNKEQFPLLLNNSDGSNTNAIYESDSELYKNSYFSLVTETFFFGKNDYLSWEEKSVFFSEKIFKPIACKHPFIIVSKPLSLKYLRTIGYKTFHPFIDESYDLIENDEKRLLAIGDEIERLSKQTPEQWIEWLTNIKEIVEHNQKTLLYKSDFNYIER